MSYDYWDRDSDWRDRNKKYKAKRAKPGVHVPGKKEASILRKIKSETGMSEAEIRQIPKYRKELSDAQKNPEAKPPRARVIGGTPKWSGSKPTDNKFPVGTVVRKRGRKIDEGDESPTRDVWIVKSSKYIQKPVNDSMYMEYWELELKNFIDGTDLNLREDSRTYDIVPPEIAEKWKKKQTYKKFGL